MIFFLVCSYKKQKTHYAESEFLLLDYGDNSLTNYMQKPK